MVCVRERERERERKRERVHHGLGNLREGFVEVCGQLFVRYYHGPVEGETFLSPTYWSESTAMEGPVGVPRQHTSTGVPRSLKTNSISSQQASLS